MNYYTDLYTTQSQSTTGTRERDVSDFIRYLFPANNFMPLISGGPVAMPEGVRREKNMFGKRRVHSPKFEAFTQSPFATEFTVTSYDGSTALVLSSTSGLVASYSLVNTANGTTCIVETVTNTTTLVVKTYGTTAFSASANDKLLVLSPHYEEKSSSPAILMSEPDNIYNVTHIFRFPVGMSETAMNSQHYGGDRWQHINRQNGAEAMRKLNNNLLFDNRPSGTAETTTLGSGKSVGSCQGLYNWKQTEYNFHGAMTFESFTQEMPLTMHESVASSDKKLLLCGYKFWSIVLGWQNEKLTILESGTYKEFGAESYKLISCRGWIEIMLCDAFDRGNFAKQALIINPEKIDYVFLKNRDIKLRPNIHSPSVDGKEDEIYGENSIIPNDGGYSIHLLKEAY